jgi:hypothetical protein
MLLFIHVLGLFWLFIRSLFVQVNSADPSGGYAAIHWAALMGFPETLQVLLYIIYVLFTNLATQLETLDSNPGLYIYIYIYIYIYVYMYIRLVVLLYTSSVY